MCDGGRPVVVPAHLAAEIIDLDHNAMTQGIQARAHVGHRGGERSPSAAHGHPAGDSRRHRFSRQSDHLVQDGVGLRSLHQQAEQLTVRSGQVAASEGWDRYRLSERLIMGNRDDAALDSCARITAGMRPPVPQLPISSWPGTPRSS